MCYRFTEVREALRIGRWELLTAATLRTVVDWSMGDRFVPAGLHTSRLPALLTQNSGRVGSAEAASDARCTNESPAEKA